ncbi:disulfide bond formation protein B [Zwartia sp.]|uniref:disulfide bond formation protein B n=1 Tax=Zwartia sp. TaxID=2978004 RepID=UPI002719C18F|nr:disulfide bond formation protein B [Zwartia sp.]MDO9025597.1 disulfide bond formation protein B [Zwartia sp.]
MRSLRLLGLLCFGAVGIALISQYVYDMQPCAWCVFQRLLYLIVGSVALLATVGQPGKLRLSLTAALVVAGSIAGMTSAWYQERVAANTFSCAQTLADQIMTKSGLESVAPWLFGIYASCMDARVKLLGLEYAWWSMLMFALVGAIGVGALWTLTRQASR